MLVTDVLLICENVDRCIYSDGRMMHIVSKRPCKHVKPHKSEVNICKDIPCRKGMDKNDGMELGESYCIEYMVIEPVDEELFKV